MIKFGCGTYNELVSMPINRILELDRWFVKDYEKEIKNKQEYDIALLKAGMGACPFFKSRK